ncbi:helix-turn-helix domain-containing protein [Aquimarina sediminis]|uniref:helix-turn-helix domain-containing protein n=1 Tax=Aquimarina sediminis TaxID=2070536 RepID=UPI000CA016AA|nr:helix-turn-helix transcriptional regulator [Aquimarina sediminis]
MTKLGKYLDKRSINKASVSRKTGINTNRLSELSKNSSTKLKADELYLIALAIEVNPCELLEYVCGDLQLKKQHT